MGSATTHGRVPHLLSIVQWRGLDASGTLWDGNGGTIMSARDCDPFEHGKRGSHPETGSSRAPPLPHLHALSLLCMIGRQLVE